MESNYCPNCNNAVQGDAVFCPHCGTNIPAARAAAEEALPSAPAAPICPSCGNQVGKDDAFCLNCGTGLGNTDTAAPTAPPTTPVSEPVTPAPEAAPVSAEMQSRPSFDAPQSAAPSSFEAPAGTPVGQPNMASTPPYNAQQSPPAGGQQPPYGAQPGQPPYGAPMQGGYTSMPGGQQPPKQKKKLRPFQIVMIVIASILVLALIALGVYFFFLKDSGGGSIENPNTPSGSTSPSISASESPSPSEKPSESPSESQEPAPSPSESTPAPAPSVNGEYPFTEFERSMDRPAVEAIFGLPDRNGSLYDINYYEDMSYFGRTGELQVWFDEDTGTLDFITWDVEIPEAELDGFIAEATAYFESLYGPVEYDDTTYRWRPDNDTSVRITTSSTAYDGKYTVTLWLSYY
ncbi:MAG: zinc-ribbon domain-containing protein [Christensenellaceae bacterium]